MVCVTLNTPPEIECGPKIDGYHHVTKIEQNQTTSYSATYRFGPDQGMRSSGDLLTEIHGNVTLNNVDHDMLFNGTGLFEETVDLRKTVTDISEVIVEVKYPRLSTFGYLQLEAPDGQLVDVCVFACGSRLSLDMILNILMNTRSAHMLYISTQLRLQATGNCMGKRYNYPSQTIKLDSWALKFGPGAGTESIISPSFIPRTFDYVHADTLTIPNQPQLRYNGDLYLVATGMNMTNGTAMVRAVEYQISDADIQYDRSVTLDYP